MNRKQLELNARLVAAAENADAAEVRRLLDAGACALAHKLPRGSSAICLACRVGSLECARLLVERGANVNRYEDDVTPLLYACRSGNTALVRYLLAAGADAFAESVEDETALYFAAGTGSPELADLLLDCGLDIEAGAGGGTPLTNACAQGNEPMARHLLARGADPLGDRRILGYACSSCSPQLVRELLEHCTPGDWRLQALWDDDDFSPMNELFRNPDGFNPEIAEMFYARGCRFAGLLLAPEDDDDCRGWNADGLEWLERHGCLDPAAGAGDEADSWGQGALNRALLQECGHGGMTSEALLLLGQGASPHAVDESGTTALMYAANHGDLVLVRNLLVAGAEVNAVNRDGETALMQSWRDSVARLLLEHGADAGKVSCHGRTAMHAAGSPELIRMLHDCGCPVDSVTNRGESALLLCCRDAARLPTVRTLLELGADPDGAGGCPPLLNAAFYGAVEVVEALLQAGASPRVRCRDTLSTPLHLAVGADGEPARCSALLRMLLAAGADPNAVDDELDTPLMLLCRRPWATVEHARLLLGCGADPALENLEGYTADELAEENRLPEITALLRESVNNQ